MASELLVQRKANRAIPIDHAQTDCAAISVELTTPTENGISLLTYAV